MTQGSNPHLAPAPPRQLYARELIGLILLATCVPFLSVPAADPEPVEVPVFARFYYPTDPIRPVTQRVIKLMKEDPGIRVVMWSGLSLPSGAAGSRRSSGRAPIMMAIAGKTAPDLLESYFQGIRMDIHQGFLYPLNEWIGDDTNGNGEIDIEEAKWERWKEIPLILRQAATYEGKVYGIPQAYTHYFGINFRVDLARAAGLDPNRPPETWDEFIYWCQKLTDPKREVPGALVKRGQRAIVLLPSAGMWLPWVESAGGSPLIQVRTSPTTGTEHEFSADESDFLAPNGEDLTDVKSAWRANYACPEGIMAAELFYRLRWMKWLIDPDTGEPVNLTHENLEEREVTVGDRTINFTDEDVITGVARAETGQRGSEKFQMLGRGEVAMITYGISDMESIGQQAGMDPDLLSWFPFPAKPGHKRMVAVYNNFATLCEAVGDRPKYERDKVWKVLTAVTDQSVFDARIRRRVLSGMARFVPPMELQRLGFDDYLRDVPQIVQRNFEELADGTLARTTQPFVGIWTPSMVSLHNNLLSLIISDTGETFDYVSALKEIEQKANDAQIFQPGSEALGRYRPAARVVFLVLAGLVVLCVVWIVRSMASKQEGSVQEVYRGWLPWVLIMPALLLIGLWGYYPLFRGLIMAFQEYRITGNSPFVGLDNFIILALDSSFWASMARTVYFVVLNLVLAFVTPILLAVFLSEVPRGKIFYRTLFFLPQVTSGMVIALLWKLMYEPTPEGLFNQMVGLLNLIPLVEIEPQGWLQDPQLAMICCVIPTVWASMGMASLIYLAALKSVPEDIYEASDVDGAGIFAKLRLITLPTLLPLIIINFVGTFVATFQNMGNIFLLTFGGPGEATMVIGMRIWIEAYTNLRFSIATSMAWILGAVLIAFTYFQIRFLRRVEFKRAEWD